MQLGGRLPRRPLRSELGDRALGDPVGQCLDPRREMAQQVGEQRAVLGDQLGQAQTKIAGGAAQFGGEPRGVERQSIT